MTELTIDRSTLLTGKTLDYMTWLDSPLYAESLGMSCALGQYLQACGVSKKKLRDGAISQLEMPAAAGWAYTPGESMTALACLIVDVNDDHDMPARAREKKLAELFRQADVEVQFTGTYAEGLKRAKAAAKVADAAARAKAKLKPKAKAKAAV